jgi:transcriptional regulator with XRE-family HTH domain
MSGKNTFSSLLSQLREEKGMTQYALARVSGLSKQAISLLEQGAREPTWDTVQLLAKALGVTCADFLDPGIELPDVEPPRGRGRPRKEEAASAPPKRKRKKE